MAIKTMREYKPETGKMEEITYNTNTSEGAYIETETHLRETLMLACEYANLSPDIELPLESEVTTFEGTRKITVGFRIEQK